MVSKRTIVLGIESTAHTFGCGIVDDEGNILADVRSVYVPEKGGIHPREAAQHHSTHCSEVVKKALAEAHISIDKVSAIAIALGPGLGPCLRSGAVIARALAVHFSKPLLPVNHAVAHIEIGKMLTGAKDPLIVYVSGGNTIIAAFSGGRYRVFGETLDIALGNCLDVFARKLGLAPPYIIEGLHVVDKYAEKGEKIIDLPYVVKGEDLSYSGLLTAALRKAREPGVRIEDLCLSFRENAYNMLVEAAERALAHTKKKEVLLTGGVGASPILQGKLKLMAKEHQAKLYITPKKYMGDNGVMIAWTGVLLYKSGITVDVKESFIKQRWRLDEVDIPWIS
ncbi:MAG: UGMP family protein [Desulfurococcales archaeon ex4484_217_1]|nr:MAG: UGMP family protein [Desulfurococcales archaeon ex4484_217_1]